MEHLTNPDPPDRLHRIVDAVLDLPPEERESAIELLCRGNADLAKAVRRALTPEEHENLEIALKARLREAHPQSFAIATQTLGPYRLLERLGEGTFGEVYVAEQSEPVRRRVAIKLLKPGMGSRQVIARFEAERQALAIMDHPHIAKIFDAGSTPLGLPYVVMEYVRGVPITTYCSENRVSLRERLALMISVCEAVQHAHQRGIIHRDLKPGNVLVTVLDGRATPKVIDFGIAKALGHAATNASCHTQYGQFIGTPAYMSPEQMDYSAVDVDTRSDVYSLGAMLYELVAGSPPYDAETLIKAGIDELRRVVREVDPPSPSTRVSGLDPGTRLALASTMQVSPERLNSQIRGEVDWIVAKATERDRARRYQSPLELAADLSAFLAGDIIKAGPRSRIYQTRKYIKRNRVPLVVGAAVALGLTATSVGTSLGLAQEAKARQRAEASDVQAKADRDKAEQNARVANDALQILTGMLTAADPAHVGGKKDMTVSEMLDRLVAWLDQAAANPATTPEPRVVMRLRSDAAGVYYWQGRIAEGKAQAAKGLALAESLYGPDSLETAKAITLVVSGYLFGQNASEEGERFARRRLAILSRHDEENSLEYIDALHGLNLILQLQGRNAEADEICRDLIRRYEALEDPPIVWHATAHADLALNLLNRGRPSEALEHIQKCLAIYETRLDEQARRQYVSRPLATLATTLLALGRHEEAEQAARMSMNISNTLRGSDHPYPMRERRALIEVLVERGKIDEARALAEAYERVLEAQGKTPGPLELYRRAAILRRQGRHDEALPIWQRIRAVVENVNAPLPATHTNTVIGPPDVAIGFAEMLGLLTDMGRPQEGIDLAERAFAAARAHFAEAGDDIPENARLRQVAAELLRACEAINTPQSRDRAAEVRSLYPGIQPAPAWAPIPPAAQEQPR